MGSGRVSTYRALASPSRVEILHLLQTEGELALRDIARSVQLHDNTVREHLDRLIAAGFVTSRPERRGTRGRPRMLYRAAAAPGSQSLDANFREHFMSVLVQGYGTAMDSPADEAAAAGARWATETLGTRSAPAEPGAEQPGATADAAVEPAPGDRGQALRQLAALEVHLDELGVEPEVDVGELKVHLRRCPFITLARERTEVVCSVHLGVARGILEHEGGPLEAARLEPLVAPHHCILHLRLAEITE